MTSISTRWKRNAIVAAAMLIFAAFLTWAVYITLIAGTTRGPNFIERIQTGTTSDTAVISIEVVEPMVGGMPFTGWEYDMLPRRRKVESRSAIKRIIWHLVGCSAGRLHQNHPASTYRAYLKVNTQSGFYWLYMDELEDSSSAVLTINSNTLNATNPNGSSLYYLNDFSELLSILISPDAAENSDAER